MTVPWPFLFFSGSRHESDLHEKFSCDGILAVPVFSGLRRFSGQHETLSTDGTLAVPAEGLFATPADGLLGLLDCEGAALLARLGACRSLRTRSIVLASVWTLRSLVASQTILSHTVVSSPVTMTCLHLTFFPSLHWCLILVFWVHLL